MQTDEVHGEFESCRNRTTSIRRESVSPFPVRIYVVLSEKIKPAKSRYRDENKETNRQNKVKPDAEEF